MASQNRIAREAKLDLTYSRRMFLFLCFEFFTVFRTILATLRAEIPSIFLEKPGRSKGSLLAGYRHDVPQALLPQDGT